MIRLIFIDDRSGLIPEGTDAYRYREGLFSEDVIPPDSDCVVIARESEARLVLDEVDCDLLTEDSFPELARKADAFIRCITINKVFCPMGIPLYKKSEKNKRNIRYYKRIYHRSDEFTHRRSVLFSREHEDYQKRRRAEAE